MVKTASFKRNNKLLNLQSNAQPVSYSFFPFFVRISFEQQNSSIEHMINKRVCVCVYVTSLKSLNSVS